MIGPVPALLEAACRGLREAVQPELQTDHARSQLAAVLDILSKLAHMTDWAPHILREEDQALAAGIAAVQARAAAQGHTFPARAVDPAAADAQADRARVLSDWIFETVPAGAQRDEYEQLLRHALRAAVAAERRHVPRSDFSAMTSSKEP